MTSPPLVCCLAAAFGRISAFLRPQPSLFLSISTLPILHPLRTSCTLQGSHLPVPAIMSADQAVYVCPLPTPAPPGIFCPPPTLYPSCSSELPAPPSTAMILSADLDRLTLTSVGIMRRESTVETLVSSVWPSWVRLVSRVSPTTRRHASLTTSIEPDPQRRRSRLHRRRIQPHRRQGRPLLGE